MIQMHADCLTFNMPDGESIPCSAELVTIELIGEAADVLDPEVVRNAARAVLHYFKVELGRTEVSVGEFSEVLAGVLRGFGLTVDGSGGGGKRRRIIGYDLRKLACESGKGFELLFFPRLRDELHQQLQLSPRVIRFRGLRGCVKQLAGARRWSARCQHLSDQIVDFLRLCLSAEHGAQGCALVVQ